jgi:hypothetical protein
MSPLDVIVLFAASLWGIVVGAIAASKKRNFGGYFVFGTAGAFIGIVIVFVSLPRAAPDERAIYQGMAAVAFFAPLLLTLFLHRLDRPPPGVPARLSGAAQPFRDQSGQPPASGSPLPASPGEGWRVYPSQVNGLHHPTPDTGTSRLDYAARALRPGDALQLVAEPDNPYDPDAVAIRHAGFHLGYVPARHDWVKRSLDEGDEHLARVARLRRDPASGALEAVEIEIAVRDRAEATAPTAAKRRLPSSSSIFAAVAVLGLVAIWFGDPTRPRVREIEPYERLRLSGVTWSSGAVGSAVSMTLENWNDLAVADVRISCRVVGPSGAETSRFERTIARRFEARRNEPVDTVVAPPLGADVRAVACEALAARRA